MTRRRRRSLIALTVAVVLAGGAVVLFDGDGDDDERADVSAEAATTSSTLEVSTTGPTTTAATATSEAPTTTVEAAPGPESTAVPPQPQSTPSTDGPAVRAAPGDKADAPPFRSSIQPVTAEQLGASWRAGCPVGPERLRAVIVMHWDDDGAIREGRLIVDAAHAERVVAIMRDVYDAVFPIERMEPIDRYGGDDQASMRANNTSAFNCRYVSGTTRWSEHSYGRAIDINPLVNPYVKGSTVDPPEGAPYADRSRNDPGMIKAGDAVVQAFERQGWRWGGYWSSGQDYQHFSASGR